MLAGFFKTRPAIHAGRELYRALAAQARVPGLYRALGAPDTVEGRFEVYVMHLVLVLHRLKTCGAEAAETAQAVFDTFVKDLDEGLRDMGVGDLSVGKKMRKLGEAVYGRIRSYDAALASADMVPALASLIGRTVFQGDSGADAGPLAAYVAKASADLAAISLPDVLAARLAWPAIDEEGGRG